MTDRRHSLGRRWFGEFAVVFLGVALALVADDYRERRSETREVRETLRVVAADLHADSLEFVDVGERMTSHAEAADWLITRWDEELDPDSVVSALTAFSSRTALQLNSSAFQGLRNANRLHLLGSDTLRSELSDYYQKRHAALEDFNGVESQLRERLIFERLAPYVRNLPGAEDGLWPPVTPPLELRTRWREAAEDPALHSEILWLGRNADYLVEFLADGEVRAGALRTLIFEFLGDDPPPSS